ncbi:MAG: class I SAM-dependent methyltransferase [bacterium]
MEFLTQTKQYIRNQFPSLFTVLKKLRNVPGLAHMNALASPITERFDASKEDDAYFKKYMDEVIRTINSLPHAGELLDIGCGHGFATQMLAELPRVTNVVALDKVPRDYFHYLDNPKITFYSEDITSFDFSPWVDRFDAVVSTEFVEHISEHDGEVLVQNVFKVVKPGGYFIGSTPLNPTQDNLFTHNPFHIREYQPSVFKKILEQVGFRTIVIKELGDCFVWIAQK